MVKEKISLKGIWSVLKDTGNGFSDNKLTRLAGSLAYFTVFSLGPLLVVIISLCGIFLKREAIEGRIYSILNDFVGQDTAAQLQQIVQNASIGNKSIVAGIIGVVILLIGATTVFAEIQDSINSIWGLKPKPKHGLLKLLINRLLSFSLVVSLGFLLLVSLSITGIIESLNDRLQQHFPEVTVYVFYVLNLLLTLGISTLIFAVIFKVLPDAKVKWKDVTTGAFVTAILFLAGKFLISFYISQTNIGSTYGAAGSLVVILAWIYYSSLILYIGAEFTKAYAVKYGSAIHPNSYAVTTKMVEVETKEDTIQQNEK
ncbi:MAG: YihY/virulence factor BrkB family protein [Bacteroidota bacterium]